MHVQAVTTGTSSKKAKILLIKDHQQIVGKRVSFVIVIVGTFKPVSFDADFM